MIKYLLLMLSLYSAVVAADQNIIVKCIKPDGLVVYTNQGCDNGKAEVVVSKSITIVEHKKFNPISFESKDVFSMPVVLSVYLLMSIICFLVYWWDKRKSIKGEWRIPETHLHWLELLGGWPGAFIAQRKLRHKNRKGSYEFVFWVIVGLHIVAWVDYLLLDHVLWGLVSNVI